MPTLWGSGTELNTLEQGHSRSKLERKGASHLHPSSGWGWSLVGASGAGGMLPRWPPPPLLGSGSRGKDEGAPQGGISTSRARGAHPLLVPHVYTTADAANHRTEEGRAFGGGQERKRIRSFQSAEDPRSMRGPQGREKKSFNGT